MTLRGLANQIQCPVLVCDAENDQFFRGQPEQLVEALGARATHRKFTVADAAGEHCHVGASDVVAESSWTGWKIPLPMFDERIVQTEHRLGSSIPVEPLAELFPWTCKGADEKSNG